MWLINVEASPGCTRVSPPCLKQTTTMFAAESSLVYVGAPATYRYHAHPMVVQSPIKPITYAPCGLHNLSLAPSWCSLPSSRCLPPPPASHHHLLPSFFPPQRQQPMLFKSQERPRCVIFLVDHIVLVGPTASQLAACGWKLVPFSVILHPGCSALIDAQHASSQPPP
jgi:hypothetical protein